jgi:hypothetical protein
MLKLFLPAVILILQGVEFSSAALSPSLSKDVRSPVKDSIVRKLMFSNDPFQFGCMTSQHVNLLAEEISSATQSLFQNDFSPLENPMDDTVPSPNSSPLVFPDGPLVSPVISDHCVLD